MRVHVLGGGRAQAGIIRRARELGHTVILSDYYAQPYAASLADVHVRESSFDSQAVCRTAKRYACEALIAVATDQPVLTAATVCSQLGLPYHLSIEQARIATDKERMKEFLSASDLPVVSSMRIDPEHLEAVGRTIGFPCVIKPADNQGQRGVYLITEESSLTRLYPRALENSPSGRVLAETYYPHQELTVSGWVHGGGFYPLLITDRKTSSFGDSLGICTAHHYPSQFENESVQIESLCERIVTALALKEGPVYIQLLRGEEGYLVNEFACRIGGAFEEFTVKAVTGVDLLSLQIALACGEAPDPAQHTSTPIALTTGVQFLFCREGRVRSLSAMPSSSEEAVILDSAWYIAEGQRIEAIKDATARAGHIVYCSQKQSSCEHLKRSLTKGLQVLSTDSRQLLYPLEGEVDGF